MIDDKYDMEVIVEMSEVDKVYRIKKSLLGYVLTLHGELKIPLSAWAVKTRKINGKDLLGLEATHNGRTLRLIEDRREG